MLGKRRIALWVALGVGALCAAISCTRLVSSDVQVVWKMERSKPDSHARRGAGRSLMTTDLECFFVSVKGVGIESNIKDGDFGANLDTGCLGLGVVSKGVPLTTAVDTGITLRIKPGPAREISVYGINAVPAATCEQTPVAQMIRDNSGAQLFKLGSATVNVGGDTRVEIENLFESSTQTDLVAECGGAAAAATRTFAYIAVPSTNSVAIYEIDEDTGIPTFSTTQAIPISSGPSTLCVHPNQQVLAVVATTLNRVHTFRILADGTLAEAAGSPFSTGGSAPKHCEFSPNGNWLYIPHYTNSLPSFAGYDVNSSTGVLTLISGSPFAVPTNYPTTMRVSPDSGYLYLGYFSVTAISGYSINSGTGAPTNLGGGFPVAIAQAPSKFLFHPTNAAMFYTIQGTFGGASFHGYTAGTGALSAATQVSSASEHFKDACITPDGKFIYAIDDNPGPGGANDSIARHVIGAGQILTAGGLTSPHYDFGSVLSVNPVDCAISPDSSTLYVSGTTDANLYHFAINPSTGGLTPGTPLPVGAGPRQIAIAAVPQ